MPRPSAALTAAKATPSAPPISSTKTSMSADAANAPASSKKSGVAEIDAAVALAARAIGGHGVFAPRPRDERGALPLQKPN